VLLTITICFAGKESQLDKLQGDIPVETLNQILGVIRQGVGLSQEAHVIPHPAFVPAARFRKISQQNAVAWAEQMKQLMSEVAERGMKAEISVVGPPGPTYSVRPRQRKR